MNTAAVAMLRRTDSYGLDHPADIVTPLWRIEVAGRFGWTVPETRTRMARFEPLGLDVPCQAEHCPDSIVDCRDLLMLTTHLDGQAPVLVGQVAPEHLHAAADESGESVADVLEAWSKAETSEVYHWITVAETLLRAPDPPWT
ncbi:hypothetical protein [Dactylosporangium salmoneum]|uniref:wHTH-Hsp90 Na associated domain-containing protein n=1 Tax=Dactylosporangium salmoneum TaxID=53361 RepID=A0ABN3HD43_9ACTN